MAPQWLSCSTAVLLLLFHVTPAVTQTSCGSGIPGIPGTHGPDGSDGPVGQKGDPGEAGQPLRGKKGPLGQQGPPGRPGMKGDLGVPGPPGRQGQTGEKGRAFNPSNQQTSFFSYKQMTPNTPEVNTDIHFIREAAADLDSQFEGDSLINGSFSCVVKGIYFFSYHISAKSRVCLKLMKGIDSHTMMCDTSEGFLVSSGSAMLELEVGDRVSLQAYKFNNIVTTQSSTSHTFTGFLVFPTG